MMQEHIKKQQEYDDMIKKLNMYSNPQLFQQQLVEQRNTIENLTSENSKLKEKIEYLENKMKQFIALQIEKRKEEKNAELLK
jgi:hypothetical protein